MGLEDAFRRYACLLQNKLGKAKPVEYEDRVVYLDKPTRLQAKVKDLDHGAEFARLVTET